jgi:cell division septation protein DedD
MIEIEEEMTSRSKDTEITLDVFKLLAIFFALVALCGVFFGLGYSWGKNSAKSLALDAAQPNVAAAAERPSAARTNDSQNSSSNLTVDKAVADKSGDSQPPSKDSTAPAETAAPALDEQSKPAPAAAPGVLPTNAYFVQVAAVSKQEDAEALVDALKKKQYPAVIASGSADKLFHVQLGPYGDVKDAEAMRNKLIQAGYNPILKK